MAGKRWQTPEQLQLIRDYLAAYNTAQKGSRGELIQFWPIIEAAWWKSFPFKDKLVAKGTLPPSVLEPEFEFIPGSPEQKIYEKKLDKRKEVSFNFQAELNKGILPTGTSQQIKTLIRYEHRQASLKSGISDPSRVAISTAAKNFVRPTRRCFQPQEMYYRIYKEHVDKLFEKEKDAFDDTPQTNEAKGEEEDVTGIQPEDGDDDKGPKKVKRRRSWNLRLCRRIFTREWEKATPEQKAVVLEEIEKQKSQISIEANLGETGKGLARDADARLG